MGTEWVPKMARTPKGEVSIENIDGWIRLRWRHQGQRKTMSLGLRHDPVNLAVAQQRANQIHLDIISGNYDPTLSKYKSDRSQQLQAIGAVDLFKRYSEWKVKQVQTRTLEKYWGLVNWLKEYFGDRAVEEEDAPEFIAYLMENLAPRTAKERLDLLDSAWLWGIEKGLLTDNPWADMRLRNPPQQKRKAFTKDEVHGILKGFAENYYYCHYTDYVRFKLSTGCRTGEANGLRWRHLNENCTVVWFGETHTHGQFKDTKTGKAREVKLSASLSKLLRSRMPADPDPDALVFPGPEGGPMTEGNFSKRAWRKVLEAQAVTYRIPYNTRHTFISHALEAGMSPVEVAAITGHNLKTLYENYAGLIKTHPTTPELF
ncbi:site-specific integrase [filamentous cyanobacterium CCT1]|nr:site-specific integrase [filamentous cyanobacterium CCT1]PSN76905.1 site-specific integrase [filamentous cyanobacterium CCP4]